VPDSWKPVVSGRLERRCVMLLNRHDPLFIYCAIFISFVLSHVQEVSSNFLPKILSALFVSMMLIYHHIVLDGSNLNDRRMITT
jgi:hypothetical protein